MMTTDDHGAARAIFRSMRDDGTCWLFVILPNHHWAITCDGHQVVVGRPDRESISSGVEKYLSLAAAGTLGPQAQCAYAHNGDADPKYGDARDLDVN
jgi:hypothetical protein